MDPRAGMSLVWGAVNAGVAANAIPQRGHLRGTVRDEKSIPITGARIYVFSTKGHFVSANDGTFSLITFTLYDTLLISLEGYESQTIRVRTDQWQAIILHASQTTAIKNRPKLISFTKDEKNEARFDPFISDETYFKLIENEFVKAGAKAELQRWGRRAPALPGL